MELRHLRYFLVVAEELSFRRAAVRLHVAQPALSVQIRQLEREMEVELFRREEGRGIKLSEAGSVFLEHARETLAAVSRGVTHAREAAKGEIGHLSIGFVPAAEYRIFPRVIPLVRENWPQVHLAFRDLKTAEQLDAMRRNEIDIGFGWLPIPSQDFAAWEIIEESLVAALPAKHRLASRTSLGVVDLSNEPLILFPQHLYPIVHRRIEELFLSVGAVMNVIYELESSPSVINFVGLGGGCSLLPGYVREIRHPGVVYRALRPPNMQVTLGMITRHGRGGLVEAFATFIAEQFTAREAR